MIINADDIQEKLGSKNQVDGPQFKIDDDPRVTIIGRFLRDTHIDELPQFINILFGQMSLIGPRPSPAKENSFCSYWRDARLSVRPGITGLWQIYRTRESGQDFQEWIYYDTKYVKNLSLKLDIKIFFQTAIKLMFNFLNHL
jgi:lipopolysaccharide/colanic/teichoic acid biosynthesis glycosyltransferase